MVYIRAWMGQYKHILVEQQWLFYFNVHKIVDNNYTAPKKPVTTMLTYPWKCTVLHCNHLGNTWKPLVLMTWHYDYCPSARESPLCKFLHHTTTVLNLKFRLTCCRHTRDHLASFLPCINTLHTLMSGHILSSRQIHYVNPFDSC